MNLTHDVPDKYLKNKEEKQDFVLLAEFSFLHVANITNKIKYHETNNKNSTGAGCRLISRLWSVHITVEI